MFHPRLIYAAATSSRRADHRKRSAATRRHKKNTEITTRRFVRDSTVRRLCSARALPPPPGRIIRPSKQIMEKRSPSARKLCDHQLIVGGCATTDDEERERDRVRGAAAPLRPPRCPIDRGTSAGGGRCCSEIRLLVAGAITSRCTPKRGGCALTAVRVAGAIGCASIYPPGGCFNRDNCHNESPRRGHDTTDVRPGWGKECASGARLT